MTTSTPLRPCRAAARCSGRSCWSAPPLESATAPSRGGGGGLFGQAGQDLDRVVPDAAEERYQVFIPALYRTYGTEPGWRWVAVSGGHRLCTLLRRCSGW